jgi:dTDP-4-amino-4,6-dideoxygalactose transaminase
MLPFFPLDMFAPHREEILRLVREAGTSNRFILKDNCARLEEELRRRTGAGDVIACASGTGALQLALKALGIGPGMEVIVQAFCCQPVASAVVNLGATPVFVDVDPRTMVMSPACVEERITERTRAILPAHLFSCMVDMPAIREIARRHDLLVVEDAAVQQGASLHGVPAGRWGHVGAFSFFQIKVLGAIGEGGAVLTDDPDLARACRMLRNHGQDGVTRFRHHLLGYNCRMDEIIAGWLLYRLPALEGELQRRARIGEYYNERFAALGEQLVTPPRGREGRCYYIYSLQTERRDEFRAYLESKGIGSHVYYPLPLPRQPAFAAFASPRDRLPNAERASRRNVAIPAYPTLRDSEVEYIADTVVKFFR